MRKLAVFLLLISCFVPLWSENFILDYYAVHITVDEARNMDIKENFSIEYTTPSHGFYRDIQYRFGDGTRAAVNLLWTSAESMTEDNGTYFSVRFGSPDKLITGGPYAYGLQYEYSLGADSYDDYDEIYYNIVAPGAWDSDISRLAFSVTLPYPVDPERIWLTAGPYGSDVELPFTISDDGCTISGRYSSLPRGYGVTIRVEMDDGYFNEAVRPFDYAFLGFIAAIAVSVLMLVSVFAVWWLRGRDERLIYPPRFSPPAGLNPMDAAYICNGSIENSAISATLVLWADKGFITISETGGDFTFTRLRELPDDYPEAEKRLFNAFFGSLETVCSNDLRKTGFSSKLIAVRNSEAEYFTGTRSLSSPASVGLRKRVMGLLIIPVILHAIASTLDFPGFLTIFVLVPSFMAYGILKAMSGQIENRIRSNGFRLSFVASPLFVYAFLWFFIVSALSSVSYSYSYAAIDIAVFLISLFASIILAASIDRRSDYAEAKLTEILGYREFIEKAEKDKIEKLSEEDPEFFYHVLPFAMALGVEDKWVKKFSGIYVEAARWYSGPNGADIYVLSSFSRRWNHVYSSSIAPRQGRSRGGARTTRGSSGFSGGGFSGGGGRSW